MEIGRKASLKFATYLVILVAMSIYSVFFVKTIVFAATYFPVSGNFCQYAQSSTSCTSTNVLVNCASGTYRPSFSCTTSNPGCVSATATNSCGGSCKDCNGLGSCVTKTCAAGNNYGCAAGNFCSSLGSCVPPLPVGSSCNDCNQNFECASGNCGGGGASVCCDAGYRCCQVDSNCLNGFHCVANDCVPTFSTTVTFYSGWNMFSVTTRKVLNSFQDSCDLNNQFFTYYNASTKIWQPIYWYQLVGGKGYWFYNNQSQPCTTTFVGSELARSSDIPPLVTGFNLIGSNATVTQPVKMLSIKGNCIVNRTLFWNNTPGNQGWQVDASTLQAGMGYWVYVNSGCTSSP